MAGARRSLIVAAFLLTPVAAAHAQRGYYPPRRRYDDRYRREWYDPVRQLSLSVGALRYDFANDKNLPMAALRADWRFASWFRGELGASYALGDLTTRNRQGDAVSTNLMTGSMGMLAELPIPYVHPYGGVAVGIFGRRDNGSLADNPDRQRTWRPTTAFPVGARLILPGGIGLRAEARFRYDQHRVGGTAADLERTVGLSFGF